MISYFLMQLPPEGSTGTLEQVLRILQGLGIPIASQKTEDPITTSGIFIDTHRFELPSWKNLHAFRWLYNTGKKRDHAPGRRELESLLGHLSHAATVVRQGRTFLRQLFPLLSLNRAPTTGSASMQVPKLICCGGARSCRAGMAHLGSFSCGAFSLSHGCSWFQIQWPDYWHSLNIAAKDTHCHCSSLMGPPLEA